MPPALATLLTLVGVLLLFRHERRTAQATSPALWLPVMWMSITGSRFVSQWINLGSVASPDYAEGSLIDALYFLALIVAATLVLIRRETRLGAVVRANPWIFLFFVYALVSIAWADYPFIAFKRWIKVLGHPLMALVILTEPDPVAAIRTVLRRCAFLLLPASVLFIKYLPEYGRGFDAWTGEGYNRGVGLTKNDLGYVCMAMAIAFAWMLLGVRRIVDTRARRIELGLCLGMLAMAFWLLERSNSATSLVTTVLGISAMVIVGAPFVTKRYFAAMVLVLVATGWSLEYTFDIYENMIRLLGRNPTLTDRTQVWADVLALQTRPVFGFGFESFWLGKRLDVMWDKWWWRPTQAHNGYIETYLAGGYVGLAILGGLLFSTFLRISRQMQTDLYLARLRLAFLLAIIVFNYTEASFKAVHFIWTIFHIIAMEVPARTQSWRPQPSPLTPRRASGFR